MLLRLIYVSRAHSKLPLELKNILAAARKNNPVLGISGAMCFIDGVYLQYLEGEAAAVDGLYQKIRNDSRHSGAKVLDRQPIAERDFPKWDMALLTWDDEAKEIFRRFNPDRSQDTYAADPATIALLLRTWAGISNWMTV